MLLHDNMDTGTSGGQTGTLLDATSGPCLLDGVVQCTAPSQGRTLLETPRTLTGEHGLICASARAYGI